MANQLDVQTGGVSRQVERAMVVDNEGRLVVVERETTGVTVENEEGQEVTVVQTAVRGLVLGSVLNRQQQPIPASRRDDDEESSCSCGCVLRCLLGILCLPCCLVCLCCHCCCSSND